MKRLLLVISTIIFSFSFISVKAQEKLFLPKTVAVEGVGINEIQVGVTNQNDVIKKFGNDYELITHDNYSKQLKYSKLGLSFFYCQKDRWQVIFSIELRKPFEVVTSKGIILGESRVQDVLKIYGDANLEHSSWLEYEGIDFRNVNLETNEINFLNNDELLINEINIYQADFTSCK